MSTTNAAPAKKTYRRPEIRVYGSLATITRGGSGTRPDGINVTKNR